eukprot:10361036-Alexandrium_andersonii.AAC.1
MLPLGSGGPPLPTGRPDADDHEELLLLLLAARGLGGVSSGQGLQRRLRHGPMASGASSSGSPEVDCALALVERATADGDVP